jgi:hypothetical protein
LPLDIFYVHYCILSMYGSRFFADTTHPPRIKKLLPLSARLTH